MKISQTVKTVYDCQFDEVEMNEVYNALDSAKDLAIEGCDYQTYDVITSIMRAIEKEVFYEAE